MGGKVIKINLVGAIFVAVLTISIILGVIIFFANKDKINNSENGKQSSINSDNKDDYNELDFSEKLTINGQEKEMTLRKYIYGGLYSIKYDVDSFFVDDRDDEKIVFESLLSDTIKIEIQRKRNFQETINKLYEDDNSKKNELKDYIISAKEVNGHICFVETGSDDNQVIRNYYIQNDKHYYEISTVCGKDFSDSVIPIIDYMVGSFEILYEDK